MREQPKGPGMDAYREKRDFGRTPEPPGREPARRCEARTAGGLFVIQEHDASRLHYDLRLELDGVLKSWAVPKGPSTEPGVRRLAVATEDHPLEYADFEGSIPEGEYGAGTVEIWDRGEWIPSADPVEELRRGHLDFELHGRKLRGRWMLVRTTPEEERAGDGGAGDEWLLIRKKDERAGGGVRRPRTVSWRATVAELPGAREAELGAPPPPQLARPASEPPAGDGWLHEVKYDGYRILCRIADGGIRLRTRSGEDWSHRYPRVVEAADRLGVGRVLLDGEVVVLRPDGRTDFQALQRAGGDERTLFYYAFDLLHLDGFDLTAVPLEARKELLREILGARPAGDALRCGDHVRGRGPEVFRAACATGAEGIVSKKADAPYRSGTRRDWVKVKCLGRQEFVVVGFTEPAGSRQGFGALLLGTRDGDGEVVYAGRVGTGFTQRDLVELRGRLDRLERNTPAVDGAPTGAGARGVHWVRPELVAEVSFAGWTESGVLRHASFQGLREDRDPADVVREAPTPTSFRGEGDDGDTVAGVRLTNPGRILWPDAGITKRQLARYWEAVAPRALPLMADRPLTLFRCPSGIDADGFYQKHPGSGVPDRVPRIEVPDADGDPVYMVVRDVADIVSLVQLGTIEFHVWNARSDRLDRPDRLVFDLDPGEDVGWAELRDGAATLRAALDHLGLPTFVRATGGKGLHLVVPLVRRTEWKEVKRFAGAVAATMERADRDRFVARMAKAERRGRIFVDYLRNDRHATAVATYSPRARPGAPVAVPLAWDELEAAGELPRWTLDDVVDRLDALPADPWEGFDDARATLTRRMWKALDAG